MATSTLTATISILMCLNIENTVACYGWNYNDEESTGKFLGNLTDPSKWNEHWKPSEGLTIQDYNYWMNNYKKKQAEKDKNALDAAGGSWPEKPDGAGADWPEHWEGLGPGSGGVPPPPWAFVKESSGKADMCFLPPNRGPCQDYVLRWGFNPYIDDCAEFVFGGCEGNTNNFFSKRRCVEACVGVPTGNCAGGSDSSILQSFDFNGIPADNLTDEGAGGARKNLDGCINSTRRSFTAPSLDDLEDDLKDSKKWIDQWTPPGFEQGIKKRVVPGGWQFGDPNQNGYSKNPPSNWRGVDCK